MGITNYLVLQLGMGKIKLLTLDPFSSQPHAPLVPSPFFLSAAPSSESLMSSSLHLQTGTEL